MNSESLQRGRNRVSCFGVAALTTVCVLSICAMTATAQSGRRAPKSAPISTPTPEATPSTKPAEKEKRSLIIGIDSTDTFSRVPLYFYDSVLQGCAHRLRAESSVKLDVQQNMNRGEAVKRAKAETETDVVLLQLRTDNIRSSDSSADLSQVFIEYFVFAPATAKQIASGNVYQQNFRTKGIPVPVPSGQSNAVYAEQRLKQAAEEAADRILSALHIASPDIPRQP